MAVEKGTKALISVSFTAYGERTFNNLERISRMALPEKSFSTATPGFVNYPDSSVVVSIIVIGRFSEWQGRGPQPGMQVFPGSDFLADLPELPTANLRHAGNYHKRMAFVMARRVPSNE